MWIRFPMTLGLGQLRKSPLGSCLYAWNSTEIRGFCVDGHPGKERSPFTEEGRRAQ